MRATRVAIAGALALLGCTDQSLTLQLVPGDDDFGAVAVGATSSPHQLILTNAAQGTTEPLLVGLAGAHAADFAVTEDTCAGQALPSGGSCHVRLTFTPAAKGTRQAMLAVSSSSSQSTPTAGLRGVGVDPALLHLTPPAAPHDYGPVLAGGPGQTVIFSVSNSGGVAGPTLAVSISGTDASMFTLGNDGCTGQAVAPDESCAFAVSFRPPLSASGVSTAALQIGGGLDIGLTGNAFHVASLTWTPGSHDYGTQPVSQDSPSGDFTFQLSNDGNLDTSNDIALSTTGAADFQLRGGTCATTGFQLAPGASCTVTIRFVAAATGLRQGALKATATAGGPGPSGVTADLDGTGQ